MAAIAGKLGAAALGDEAVVGALVALGLDPPLLLGYLIAYGVYEAYEALFPDGPATQIPRSAAIIPRDVFRTPIGGERPGQTPALPGPPAAASRNIFDNPIGGDRPGQAIGLRSRARRPGELPQEAQETAAARLGQAAGAASRGEEVKETLIDIPLDEPAVERLPRPVRVRPSLGGIKKVAAAAGATGATGAAYQAARGAAGSGATAAPSDPVTGTSPVTPTQPTQPVVPSTPSTPSTTIGTTLPGSAPAAPATPPGPAWTRPGAPIGSTPAMEGMRQAAQIPGKSSPYASGVAGTWIMPKRGAYTRELWYKVAAGNASRLLSA